MPSDDDSDLIIEIKIFSEKTIMPHHAAISRSITNNLQRKSRDKSQKALHWRTNWRKENEDGQKYKNHQVQKTEKILV